MSLTPGIQKEEKKAGGSVLNLSVCEAVKGLMNLKIGTKMVASTELKLNTDLFTEKKAKAERYKWKY